MIDETSPQNDEDPEGLKACFDAIMKLRAQGGTPIPRAEEIAFLRIPAPPISPYGLAVLRAGRRGNTVDVSRYYELADERRRRRLFKLERLPKLRLGTTKAPDQYLLNAVDAVVQNPRIALRHRAREVERFLTTRAQPCPDISTIRRWLKKLSPKLRK
jgi:hypothetical protein